MTVVDSCSSKAALDGSSYTCVSAWQWSVVNSDSLITAVSHTLWTAQLSGRVRSICCLAFSPAIFVRSGRPDCKATRKR